MTQVDQQVLATLINLIDELAGDWEYDGVVGPDTYFIADLGLESLEIVVIGTMLEERYGRLPFAEYLEELGQRPAEDRDVTVAELAAFVCEHRQPILEEA